jgi:hypothetical protein
VTGSVAFISVISRWVQASVIVSVAFVGVISKWTQALLANSALTKAALSAKSVLKIIRKQLKSCFLKLLLAVTFKTKALKALLHLSLFFFFYKRLYIVCISS